MAILLMQKIRFYCLQNEQLKLKKKNKKTAVLLDFTRFIEFFFLSLLYNQQ